MNRLAKISEFQKVLINYQASEETQKLVRQTPFVLLAAITSSGRNTMIREIIKTNNYHFVVSDTTRKPRVNDGVLERNGKEYWFKSEDQVLSGLQAGKYVEAAIIHDQQVSGVSIKELELASKKNLIAISDIDVQGVDRIHAMADNTVPVFVIPPNYDQWRDRLAKRGHMTDEELTKRLASAREELEMALSKDYYHFLINNSLKEAIKGLDKIAHGHIDKNHEVDGRKVAEGILQELRIAD